MNNIVKWGFRSLTLLCVVIVALLVFAYFIASRSVADYNESFSTNIGDYNVDIVRDRQAVPHIFGDDFNQAMFGLGVAHAQERLWQMSVLRRTAQGRLSEMGGADLVELDLFLRSLDLWNLSNRQFQKLPQSTKNTLQAYADGVNAQVAEVNRRNLGAGAPEFYLVNREFAPWTPVDSMAILKIMALQLSSGAQNEILRAKLSTVLDEAALSDIFYDAPTPKVSMAFADNKLPEESKLAQALTPTGYGRISGASNAFAAAPSRSTSGGALLASDPHLKLTAPSVWMLAHLATPQQSWVGGTIPGIPLVLIGHNNELAWGLTTANLDDQDITIVKNDPNDPSAYMTPTGKEKYKGEEILINVKGESQPRKYLKLTTKYGPIIPANGPWKLGEILPENHLAALSWTALEENDQTIIAGLNLMKSLSVASGVQALKDHGAPAQVFTLADSKGNIGQIAAGRMPIRTDSNLSKGILPAISWSGDAGFASYFPFEKSPRNINPASGIVMHTNNKFIDRAYPEHYSYSWGDNYRYLRAQNLFERRKTHSTDSFVELQNDSISQDAINILPLIAEKLWFQTEQDGQRADVLVALGNWNGRFDALGPEALIYTTWLAEIDRLIFSDELGPMFADLGQADPYRIERIYRNVGGAAKWCDVTPTPEQESCADISNAALDKALARLTKQYGEDFNQWRWGHAHKAVHENEVLGNVPLLGFFANISQEVDGGSETLLRTASKSDDPFNHTAVHGGALRMVVNFADLQHAKFIISTGQSGNIVSKYYDDLSSLWAAGEYIEIPTEREFIETNALGQMNVRTVNAETVGVE